MTIGDVYINGWIVGIVAVLLAVAVWRAVGRELYALRRLRFAADLEKFCREKKLSIEWLRPTTDSLWDGFGQVDFVIDGRIHVAMLSYPRRGTYIQLGEDRVTFTRQKTLMQPQRAGKYNGYLHMGETITRDDGWARLHLCDCDAPAGDARVLLVYPMAYAVNDCRSGTSRAIGTGAGVAGEFQLNNRTSFYARLEEYAETGELSMWTPSKPSRKYE